MNNTIVKTDQNVVPVGTGSVLVSRQIILITFPSNQGSAFVIQGTRVIPPALPCKREGVIYKFSITPIENARLYPS